MAASPKKKKRAGFLQKLFSKSHHEEDEPEKEKKKDDHSRHAKHEESTRQQNAAKHLETAPPGVSYTPGGRSPGLRKASEGRKISTARKKRKESSGVYLDPSQPLEFPATPELILEAHKQRALLSPNEEWLLVELNEYECLVDSHDIIKVIAKDSKYFEVDPDELWQQFFEFVEDCPAYDEVINYDIWQEFRLKYYQC